MDHFPGTQGSFCLPSQPLVWVKPVCGRAVAGEATPRLGETRLWESCGGRGRAERRGLLQGLSAASLGGSNHPARPSYSRLFWLWRSQLKGQNDARWDKEPCYIVACAL